MSDILVTSPFRPFTLPNQFKAVFNGYVYCGTVDAVDPSVSQVQVYLINEAGDRVPVAQPLRTNAGGYLVYNGQPAKFVTDSNHSLLVQDSFQVQVWYAPGMSTIDPESALNILAGEYGSGMVGRTNYQGVRTYSGSDKSLSLYGRDNIFDGAFGQFNLDDTDLTSEDNDGTILIDALGRRWKREIASPLRSEWWGVNPSNTQAANGANFVKLCEYLSRWGGWLQLPDGDISTTGGHVIDNTIYGLPIKLQGGPNTRIVTPTGFTGDALTISGSSRATTDEIVFAKQTNDYKGRGLVVNNTAYAEFNKISAFGYLNGIYTSAVLTSLFIKPLCRFNDIGMYLDYGAASSPNAITIINPSLSLNQRWGLRSTRPASLKVIGGSIEGNGWGQTSFHGGAYISNPGLEGGVGVSFDGVHMEQNAGEADIHIATSETPDVVINITGCPIFPIDNTHFTNNRIYIENSVRVVANIYGNSFKHYGSYTPNASRKHINVVDPTLATVNTWGDDSQFASSIEAPELKSWGPNVIRAAILFSKVRATAVGAITGTAYNVSSVSKTSTGEYFIGFAKNHPTGDYVATPLSTNAARTCNVVSQATNGFSIQTRDLTGALVDSGFTVIVS